MVLLGSIRMGETVLYHLKIGEGAIKIKIKGVINFFKILGHKIGKGENFFLILSL